MKAHFPPALEAAEVGPTEKIKLYMYLCIYICIYPFLYMYTDICNIHIAGNAVVREAVQRTRVADKSKPEISRLPAPPIRNTPGFLGYPIIPGQLPTGEDGPVQKSPDFEKAELRISEGKFGRRCETIPGDALGSLLRDALVICF